MLDTNILLRFADTTSYQHAVTVAALNVLRSRGDDLRTLPQSFYEFWVVATRPRANHGLGLPVADCVREVARLRGFFPLLDDPPGLFDEWLSLVTAHPCHGKVAHDARYAAALRRHGLTRLLTFNGADFARFPGVTVLDPNAVARPPAS